MLRWVLGLDIVTCDTTQCSAAIVALDHLTSAGPQMPGVRASQRLRFAGLVAGALGRESQKRSSLSHPGCCPVSVSGCRVFLAQAVFPCAHICYFLFLNSCILHQIPAGMRPRRAWSELHVSSIAKARPRLSQDRHSSWESRSMHFRSVLIGDSRSDALGSC